MQSNSYSFFDFSIDIELKESVMRNQEQVILFGGGGILFNRIFEYLSKNNIKILGIIDNNKSMQGKKVNNLKVFKPEVYKNKDICVIMCSQANSESMEKNLNDLNIKKKLPWYFMYMGRDLNYYEYTESIFEMLAENEKKYKNIDLKQQFQLDRLEIVMTEKCSLKCRNCSNLIQYFEFPRDMDINITLKSLDRIMNNIEYLSQIRLLGGEPFIYKNLYKYIEHIEDNYNNYGNIVIFTNGTIVPRGKNLECLKKNNVVVLISNYGEVSKSIEEIKNVFEKNKILYSVMEMDNNWIDCSNDLDYCNEDKEILTEKYSKCNNKHCNVLKNNKFFICPFSANAFDLKSIPKQDIEYVDVSTYAKDTILKEELIKIKNKEYLKACNYCSGRDINQKKIKPAIQTKEILEYKKYI